MRGRFVPVTDEGTEKAPFGSSWTNGSFLLDQRVVPFGPTLCSSSANGLPVSFRFFKGCGR